VVIPLDELADVTFEKALMGDGVAIRTSDLFCLAPVAGRVSRLLSEEQALVIEMECGHAVAIRAASLQADTKITMLVTHGQAVSAGQKIFAIDVSSVQSTNVLAAVSIVISGGKEIEITPADEVTAGEDTVIQFER
jgi:PTS system glucose-specific IIC component